MGRKLPDLSGAAGVPLVLGSEIMEQSQDYLRHETPQEFAERLGLSFSDPFLLTRALTHRSFLNEHPEAIEDNERLEFLGDAVLDFLVGAWLYNRFPEMNEGDLTRLRSALVRTENLAQFSLEIDLGAAILLGRGEEEAGGRERTALLCAVFEAFIGALFLEKGIAAVEDFIAPMLEITAGHILSENKDKDAKSLLQEWAQGQGLGTPYYRTVIAYGPDHAKVFEVEVYINSRVIAKGSGHSKQAAAKSAALTALNTLGVEIG